MLNNSPKKILAVTLFGLYLAVLLKLLIFRYSSTAMFNFSGGNFVPFKTIGKYLINSPAPGVAFINLVGNIAVFIPFGIFIPLLRRSSKWKIVFVSVLVFSFAMETVQGLFRVGVFDVDDIFLNVLGALFGYGIFALIKSVCANRNA